MDTVRGGFEAFLDEADRELAAARQSATYAAADRDAAVARVAVLEARVTELVAEGDEARGQVAALIEERDRLLARIEELENPPPPPAPMKFGVSATSGDFPAGYLRQVAESEAEVGYYYGQDPRWSNVAGFPDDHDLWMQTKATTKAAYVAMLATFPATRSGKVFLHYHNEPEDQIERGEMTLEQWQQRTDWLYEAIAESGKTYVVPSIEVMYWDLQQTLAGTAGPARLIDNYLRPGVMAVGMSAYAEKKLRDGHEVASTSPGKMPATIGAWSKKVGLPVSVITGWAVDTALLNDPITLANRVAWTRTAAANLAAAGIRHMMWFDIPWSNGDYRLSSDPNLLGAWRELTEA